MKEIIVSSLPKTWLIDLDGTIVKHNGYLENGHDTFLEGAKEFLQSIDVEDTIIFLTSRMESEKFLTMNFLNKHRIRYNHIIFNLPYGERLLINDKKISGLKTALAMNVTRDEAFQLKFSVDESL